jgi:hypothetical protein
VPCGHLLVEGLCWLDCFSWWLPLKHFGFGVQECSIARPRETNSEDAVIVNAIISLRPLPSRFDLPLPQACRVQRREVR